MTNQKTTKRALLLSVLSLFVCVAMLVGVTFAWFTDTVTTGVNSIVAGTLNIDLIDSNGDSLEGKTIGFTDMGENAFWEPGCRYTLEEIKLVNNGKLNAKYKVVINAVTGDVDLSEVIDVYETVGEKKVYLGTLKAFLNKSYGIKEGVIAPDETLSFGELTFVMQTTAGNEYQDKAISNIAITVYATQATVENDSIDNQYDAGALYGNEVAVSSQAELDAAIANATTATEIVLPAGTFTLPLNSGVGDMTNKDITFSSKENAVLDFTDIHNQFGYINNMSGARLTFDGITANWSQENERHQGLKNPKSVVYRNCVITGTQFMYSGADFINCTFVTPEGYDGYNVYCRASGSYSFTDCVFTTGGRAIMIYNDAAINVNIAVNNCKFSDNGTYTSKPKAAVETGDYATSSVFNIKINNCEITEGFETNNSTSKLWGNKDNMPKARLNVIIDGVDVY